MCVKIQIITDLSNEDKECIEKVLSIKKGEKQDVSIKRDLGK